MAAYNASRSAMPTRAPIAFEIHWVRLAQALADLLSPSPWARRSEISLAWDLPAFFSGLLQILQNGVIDIYCGSHDILARTYDASDVNIHLVWQSRLYLQLRRTLTRGNERKLRARSLGKHGDGN